MADESKPLDGKTTFDDKVIFEAQRLSYDAARVIAEKIAKRISGRTKDHAVVIAGTQFLADLSSLAATAEVLVELEQDYHAFAHPAQSMTRSVSRGESNAGFHAALIPPLLPILSAATAAAQGALSLVSLFRQDVDYKGVPVSIDTVAFEIELAARVRMHKAREVIVPDLVVFRKPSSAPGSLKT
nr:hypothetical protein [Gemmatimonadaceae bacterium]